MAVAFFLLILYSRFIIKYSFFPLISHTVIAFCFQTVYFVLKAQDSTMCLSILFINCLLTLYIQACFATITIT